MVQETDLTELPDKLPAAAASHAREASFMSDPVGAADDFSPSQKLTVSR